MTKKRILVLSSILLAVLLLLGIMALVMMRPHIAQKMVDAIEANDYDTLQELCEKHPKAINTAPTVLPLFLRRLMDAAAVHTPLQVAAQNGRYEMVQLLLLHGADVNLQDDLLHDTPLNRALAGNAPGKYEVANLLLKNGANVTLRRQNNDDYDALGAFLLGASKAFSADEESLFYYMLTLVDKQSYDYGNLLETAILFNRTKALSLLAEDEGFDINRYSCHGTTPLIYACQVATAQYETVATLLQCGADKTAKDKSGKTAYDYAVESEMKDIAELVKP